ncbi:MAG: hypothetical protein R3D44_16105 [Hyphomicrobiaceae bacterium]
MSRNDGGAAAPVVTLDGLSLRPSSAFRSQGLLAGVVVASLGATVAVLVGGIALATDGQASGLSVLAERPLAAAQIAAGLSLWSALLAVPIARGLARLWVRREVRVRGNEVEIVSHTPFGIRRRYVSLDEYQGIAHHIRASLSGLTHEVVMVHPQAALNVTLHSGDRVTEAMLEECKRLLGLPEISARAIYERGQRIREGDASSAIATAGA